MAYGRTRLSQDSDNANHVQEENIMFLSERMDLFFEVSSVLDVDQDISDDIVRFRLWLLDHIAFKGMVDDDVIKMGMLPVFMWTPEHPMEDLTFDFDLLRKIVSPVNMDLDRINALLKQLKDHCIFV